MDCRRIDRGKRRRQRVFRAAARLTLTTNDNGTWVESAQQARHNVDASGGTTREFAPGRLHGECATYNAGMETKNSPARVLVAEDNPQGAELLEAFLSDTDYEVRTVGDGEETMRVVREWKPDLILLDVMMPKLSGFEVCKRLKSDPATRRTPILMITALDQPSDIERAVDVGTNDFLTKPINKFELLRRVRAMLASYQGRGELAETIDYINAVQEGK